MVFKFFVLGFSMVLATAFHKKIDRKQSQIT